MRRRHRRSLRGQYRDQVHASRNALPSTGGRRRSLRHEPLEPRVLLAGDMTVRFDFVEPTGSPVDTLLVDHDYVLRLYVRDARAAPTGVQQAYFDVFYDRDLIAVTGPVEAASDYLASASGSVATPGLIDEAGGADTDTLPPASPNQELLLLSIPIQAKSPGVLELTTDLSEVAARLPRFFQNEVTVPLANIDFAGTTKDVLGPAILVSPASGLETTEMGGEDTFEISLLTAPTANVTIPFMSNDLSEGTVSPASVTFTPANWNTPQLVTVGGVDDAVADGNINYVIVTGPAASGDPDYDGRDAVDVSVSNLDNDSVGISVQPTTGQTTESGGTDTFQIVLNSEPLADVAISLSSSNVNEGTVSPAAVTFTPATWNSPQTITVTGQDDDIADGNQTFSIVTDTAVSGDPSYNGRPVADVSITNVDNDAAGITVQPTTGQTTESGGTDTFEIVLTSRPVASVTIELTSSDTGEGTVAPSSVTFTPEAWNTPQSITVTGQDDDVVDGNTAFIIYTSAAVSADASYNGRDVADVSITNLDNDAAGISVVPTTGVTSESGTTASFDFTLNSRPSASVTIELSSSDTSEGIVAPAVVTFTPQNWNTPQQVTVTGQDDDQADGNVVYSINTAPAVSEDADYQGRKAPDVAITNLDNDAVGITVEPTVGETTEAGGTTSFSIVLNSRPTADVAIGLSSTDETEGIVSTTQVAFTVTDWSTPQIVTVTGQDDQIADGNIPYTIVTAPAVSQDPNYSNRDASDVAMSNRDNDSADIIVVPTSDLETTESGGTASFQIRLGSQPLANVTIDLSSDDITEGIATPSSVTFTSENWDLLQAIAVEGQDDQLVDGDISYTIVTAPARSTDPGYDGRDAADVVLTNRDDDVAMVTVVPTSGLTTSEWGETSVFEARLSSQPSADVTFELSSSDLTEGSVTPESVRFTPANWNVAQMFLVSGVDDDVDDGDVQFFIQTGSTLSDDIHYNNLTVEDVQVVNADDDVANLVVSPMSGLETDENGGEATFSIHLTTEPAGNVAVQITSSDSQEGSTAPGLVTFTSSNWDTPQTVTVQGEDDAILDGDIDYELIVAIATTDDPAYGSLDPVVVAVVNRDNDVAGIEIGGDESLVTSEDGDSAIVTMMLTAQPGSNVTVAFTTSDNSEGATTVNQITFTAADWNIAQSVTIVGADDPIVDGSKNYSIIATSTSADAVFDNLPPITLSVLNLDNDSAQLILSTSESSVVEQTGDTNPKVTWEVELVGEVEGGFTLAFATNEGTASASTGDYVDNDGFITFAGVNGETYGGEVEVTADNRLEPDETFSVTVGPLGDISPNLAAQIDIMGSPLEFTILDDDDLTLSFFGVTQDEGTSEDPTSFLFDVELSNPVQGGVRITYTTNDDSATVAGNDYVDNDGVLEFAGENDLSRSIKVLVTADAAVEQDETFVVTLEEIVFLDPGLAESIDIQGGSQTGTIVNDDTAFIAFVQDAGLAVETAGRYTIQTRLSVSGGGTLTEEASVELLVQPGGTAMIPDDYTLTDTMFTFPAGSRDGAIRTVDMLLVTNDGDEGDEYATFQLELVSGSMDGRVTVGEPSQHEVTLSEDPGTARVSGMVWFDANDNGRQEEEELPIPGVVVALSGVDLGGQIVEMTRMTDDDGRYQFDQLPAGTYTLNESQPSAFLDGIDVLGTVEGAAVGVLENDRVSGIVLNPADEAEDYDFGEKQLAHVLMSRRLFLASTPPLESALREVVARGEELEGNLALAAAVRRGESVAVRRIGTRVELTGTSLNDQFLFVAAGNSASSLPSQHLVSVNGLQWNLAATEIDTIILDAGRGDDEVELRDSPQQDHLTASHDLAILSSDDFRVEAMAFDLVRAISSSGGQDRVTEDNFHHQLELEGPWLD